MINDNIQRKTGRAVLFDPSVSGQSHILGNTGFIAIAAGMYESVVVIARDSHIEALIQYLNDDIKRNITFVAFKDRKEVPNLINTEIKKAAPKLLMALNLEYNTYVQVSLLLLKYPKLSMYWLLHSHLLSFAQPGSLKKPHTQLKKFALFNLFPKSKFIVYSNRIKQNLEPFISKKLISRKIKSVFHPIGVDYEVPAASHFETTPNATNLLFIQGWHSVEPDARAALDEIKAICASDKTRTLTEYASGVTEEGGPKRFSRDYQARLDLISSFSYFVHLPIDSYKLQTSGALMDLLLTQTPAIGIRTDFATELADTIGDFGYFFDSMDALVDFMRSADSATLIADRERFSQNLRSGKDKIKEISTAQAYIAGL
jgi:hypothetical protein